MTDIITEPRLASIVNVQQSGVRSINIESDLLSTPVAGGYVLTDQARNVLGRIINRLNGDFSTRAWTLTGPYGSGKSYFGLYLMNLLAAGLPSHQAASSQLYNEDQTLAKKVRQTAQLESTNGFLVIPVVGRRATIESCVKKGVLAALQPHETDQAVQKLFHAYNSNGTNLSDLLKSTHQVALNLNYQGAILVLDEMGKLLEYAAAHPEAVDVYTFQEIAEFANRSGENPFLFIGVLHQSFERYAGRLDSTTRREWSKVQGRYEDIAFQEPPIQQMRLATKSLHIDISAQSDPVTELIQQNAAAVAGTGWKPPTMDPEEFQTLSLQAYPFHPTTLIALPYLFRRLAQNERSMFAYLSSHEPYGFQEFLQQNAVTETVRLAQLFDYLTANFQGRLYATMRARLITETLERLYQADAKLDALERDVLKTIGLMNWLTEVSPLQASETELIAAIKSPKRPPAQIQAALESLRQMSLIVFRRFNHTYAVWQGSDVDLDNRLQDAHRRLTGAYSLAEAVQTFLPPRPIVASRHSYQTGSTRYFELRYVDVHTLDQLETSPPAGAGGIVFLCIPSNPSDLDQLNERATDLDMIERSQHIVGIAQHTARLAELVSELRALHWVKDNTPELRDDPVARRELRARLHRLESMIRHELERSLTVGSLSEHDSCRWYYQGKDISNFAARGLSHLLSHICDELFAGSPRLWNELINRQKLSSQGAAARRNLIEAMITHSDQLRLGIEGYPPERSMYESMLKASGLHRPAGPDRWVFVPPQDDNPLRLAPVWKAIADYVFAVPPEPRSVQALFDQLAAPPYGLTNGVMPVLLCAFLLVHQNVVTLYSEGSLLPEPTIPDWEVLLRRPELFAIAGSRVTGPRAEVVDRLARGLGTTPAALPVIRDLIRRLKSLPQHVWRTNQLSTRTLAVRTAVEKARSPEQLLFHALPVALDLKPFPEKSQEEFHTDNFFNRLNVALQELADRMPQTLTEAQDTLLAACALPNGVDGWRRLQVEAAELLPQVNQPQLEPLLLRAVNMADDETALESVLAYVAGRPPQTWSDRDTEHFEEQAKALGQLYQQERAVWLPYASLTQDQQERSQTIATDLRSYLADQFEDDSAVIDAALYALLQRKETNQKQKSNSKEQDV